MTWPAARAALKTLLDGATADVGAGFQTETLHAYEFPPAQIQVDMLPCAFIHGPREEFDPTYPNLMHSSDITCRIEVALGGPDDMESLSKRRDAWVQAFKVKASLATSQNLSGSVSAVLRWTFDELRSSNVYEGMWGFDAIVEMNSYEV